MKRASLSSRRRDKRWVVMYRFRFYRCGDQQLALLSHRGNNQDRVKEPVQKRPPNNVVYMNVNVMPTCTAIKIGDGM